MKNIKQVVIIEYSSLTRIILDKMISSKENLNVCATFDNAEDCINYVLNNPVHLVLMDMCLPTVNGINTSRILHEINPELKLLLFFSSHSDYEVLSALYSNADAYLFKNITREKLHKVIDSVLKNELWIDLRIQHSIFNFIKAMMSETDYYSFRSMLTTKEFNLMNMVLKGFKRKEVACFLNISLSELSLYVYSIFEKLAKIQSIELAVRNLKYDLC